MADILTILEKAKTALNTITDHYTRELMGLDGLTKEIDEAIERPELRMKTPSGELVVSVAHNESYQASVTLDNEQSGEKDLFLAEIPEGDLLEIYKKDGIKEGDIRMLSWEDIWNEDYTHSAVIKAEDIRELEQSIKDENEKQEGR